VGGRHFEKFCNISSDFNEILGAKSHTDPDDKQYEHFEKF